MKNRGFLLLIGFAVLILAVGVACSALSSTPTTEPVGNPTSDQVQSPTSDGSTTNTSTASDLITFTDQILPD